MKMEGTRVDPRLCTACRACEVACSLHLTGQHNPAASAIRVSLDRADGSVQIVVLKSCDRCEAEDLGALCVEVCQPGALRGRPAPSVSGTQERGNV